MSPFGCIDPALLYLELSALLMIKQDYVPAFISQVTKITTAELGCHDRYVGIPLLCTSTGTVLYIWKELLKLVVH